MRYYLACDKRKGENRFSFVSMDILAKIVKNEKLQEDNNLKAIYDFTTTFNSQKDLIDFLIQNKLIVSTNKYESFYIIYEIKNNGKSNFYTLPIAYKKDKLYFSFGYIAKRVVDKNKIDENYLKSFVSFFKNKFYLSEEYYILKSMSEGYVNDDKIYAGVQDLINKVCYVKRGNKYVFNFRNFYEIAMNMALLDMPLKNKKASESNKAYERQLSIVQEIEREYLRDRAEKTNDEQTRLF